MRLAPMAMQMRKQGLRMIGIEPREPDDEFYAGRVRYAQANGAPA